MANAFGINSVASFPNSSSVQFPKMKTRRVGICFLSASASAASVSDPYRTLRIRPDASKSEVKKAFRQLALQYHPDVCRENNSGVQFHRINEAYDMVMSQLRGESTKPVMETYEPFDEGTEDADMEMTDPDFDLWEEWMGWEGAGTRDYSSHINPYL